MGWALLRVGVLWKPVLPTVLPDGLDRAGTALALGLAAGAAVVVVLAGGPVLRLAVRRSSPAHAAGPAPD